jgi:hypothetical protein
MNTVMSIMQWLQWPLVVIVILATIHALVTSPKPPRSVPPAIMPRHFYPAPLPTALIEPLYFRSKRPKALRNTGRHVNSRRRRRKSRKRKRRK